MPRRQALLQGPQRFLRMHQLRQQTILQCILRNLRRWLPLSTALQQQQTGLRARNIPDKPSLSQLIVTNRFIRGLEKREPEEFFDSGGCPLLPGISAVFSERQ